MHKNSPITTTRLPALVPAGLAMLAGWVGAAWATFLSLFCIGTSCESADLTWWAVMTIVLAATATVAFAVGVAGAIAGLRTAVRTAVACGGGAFLIAAVATVV